jgi:multisubunit Na+/H+ antiporter MnhG subunit
VLTVRLKAGCLGRGGIMSADIWASVIVLIGGLLVFFGSIAQARGDLRQYRDLLAAGKQAIDGEQTIETIKTIKALAGFLADDRRGIAAAQIVVLPLIAAWPGNSVQVSQPGREAAKEADARTDSTSATQHLEDLRNRVEQALNDAAGWGLILVGSLAAVIATVIQVYLLIWR